MFKRVFHLLFALLCFGVSLSHDEKQFQWNLLNQKAALVRLKGFNERGIYQQSIVVGFGTYGTELSHVKTWLEHLYEKRLKDLGVASIIAVKGPETQNFNSKEQVDKVLMNTITRLYGVSKRPNIILLAHGEGAYVAHALLENMRLANQLSSMYNKKIIYFMLDGTAGGYQSDFATKLLKTYGVYAFSERQGERINSRYHTSVLAVQQQHARNVKLLPINSTEAGCKTNYCLQDTLINKKPGNPSFNNILFDYVEFGAENSVTHEYLDILYA